MEWVCLVIAGFLEVAWAVGLKYAAGWTRPGPSVFTVAAMCASVFFLERAVRVIPVGTGYAVWTGIGAAGTAALGVALFSEPLSVARVLSVLLIIAGIIGLKLSS